jgi:hypothetical protein
MQGTTINDLENLVPLAAKVVRILPSTLLLALGLLHLVAKVTARLVPDDIPRKFPQGRWCDQRGAEQPHHLRRLDRRRGDRSSCIAGGYRDRRPAACYQIG